MAALVYFNSFYGSYSTQLSHMSFSHMSCSHMSFSPDITYPPPRESSHGEFLQIVVKLVDPFTGCHLWHFFQSAEPVSIRNQIELLSSICE